ncbi:type VII secretion target [Mycobacteroides abscessus]|uniref:type VII secretion target n=1 Tax=Mycobacteroides abscessus TaxID=36809 RepID=UPI000C255C64|nr:type VII secretion target [Mycobacteroides abscessus]RIU26778.1 hypothetical protein D2E89_04035 [Mycobacteroides abscessus]
MADHLGVDTGGLGVGAARSEGLAAELTGGEAAGGSGNQPSHMGVSAILAAARTAREHQAGRMSGHASTLRSNASQYDGNDRRSATDIAQAM